MGLRDLTIADVIRRNARLFGDRVAFIFPDRRISHREYLARVERLATGLAAAGVVAGDRVAVMARNVPEYADLYGAVAWLGAILLPVNWRLSADEAGYVLADGAPRLVIVGEEDQPVVAGIAGTLRSVTGFYTLGPPAQPFEPFAKLVAGAGAPPRCEADPDAGYVIIHTAAVDGRPRGALISQSGLMAGSIQQLIDWHLDERDVGIVAVPLFHVTGLGLMLTMLMAGGASLVAAKFDPDSLVRQIAAERATVFAEFAPMLANLLDKAAEIRVRLDSLRVVVGLDTKETIGRFEADHPDARFWAVYGQSETSGLVTLAPWRERPGSAGRPTLLNIVDVVDEVDQVLPAGQVGEIVVRGPMVFLGYWRRDDDNTLTFRSGWHHTGDMGRFDDDGYLWYAGRSPTKELIKPGGENVYPAEVEKVLREHGAVADAVVIGVPDPQWGEAVKAVCVRRPDQPVSDAELIEFVGSRLARYKKPKHVAFVEALPKTAQGTVDRAAVKQQHGGS
jgi:acyl-CoA synthetase (AMP-forming)/AMP-acid ligase II